MVEEDLIGRLGRLINEDHGTIKTFLTSMRQDLQVGLQHAHIHMIFLATDAEISPAAPAAVHLVQLHQSLTLLDHVTGSDPSPAPHHPGEVICQNIGQKTLSNT